ncbi:unnamed protein product [Mucor fragilis]
MVQTLTSKNDDAMCIDDQRQPIQYLNKVCRYGQPVDSDMFKQKQMLMKQIYSETVTITDLIDKSSRSFSAWCGTAKLDLVLAQTQTHKIQKNDVSKIKMLPKWRPKMW